MFGANLARAVFATALLSLFTLLYAADKFPEFPVHQAGDYAISLERACIKVGVQPVEDVKEQKYYFHTEMSPKGFLPVFIVLQNVSTCGDSFLFDKANIKYGLADLTGSPPKTAMSGANVATIDSLAIASGLVGVIFADVLFGNSEQVQQNIVRKEVQSKTLSPGVSTHGFLYVRVPKKGAREKIRLRVMLTRTGSDESFVLELVV